MAIESSCTDVCKFNRKADLWVGRFRRFQGDLAIPVTTMQPFPHQKP